MGPSFDWNGLILHLCLVLLVDMMDENIRLLSKSALVIEACGVFHFRKNNQTFLRQQAHRLGYVAVRETNGKGRLQH